MGSTIEINDTLKISKERGFPQDLTLERHTENPDLSGNFLGRKFEFYNKDERLYHRLPTPVRLVEEMEEGRWLFWGHALVESQTIGDGKTSGVYRITKIYSPEFQKQITIEESPAGKSYFQEEPTSMRIE